MVSVNTPISNCIPVPDSWQSNTAYYYKLVSGYITSYLNTAYTKELFGKDPNSYYNYVNNIWYLLLMISVISEEQQNDVNNGVNNPCSYYAGQFDCLVSYFKCLNVDITPLLGIYGFTCNGVVPGPDGIGVMAIDNISINNHIFKIG